MSEKQGLPILEYSNIRDFREPGVIFWYKVFIGITAFIYLFVSILLIFVFMYSRAISLSGESVLMLIAGCILLPISVAMSSSLYFPRKKWAWVLGIVLLVLSMCNLLSIILGILLIIFWVRKENRIWYKVIVVPEGYDIATDRNQLHSVFYDTGRVSGPSQTLSGDHRTVDSAHRNP